MEEYGYTAGCRRFTLLRTGRSAYGVHHTEACRARFEGILRANQDPSMARADARVDEHLAAQVQARVESVPVVPPPLPRPAGASSSSSGPAVLDNEVMGHPPRCTVVAIRRPP